LLPLGLIIEGGVTRGGAVGRVSNFVSSETSKAATGSPNDKQLVEIAEWRDRQRIFFIVFTHPKLDLSPVLLSRKFRYHTRVKPLPRQFFEQPTYDVARKLLGVFLMGGPVPLRIVETEAYGVDDPASHAFRGKSRANSHMFGVPGHAYVHINYGIHHCLNVVCQGEGVGEAVLIRAVDFLGAERTQWAGPGRLAKSLGVRKDTHDGIDLLDTKSPLWLAEGEQVPDENVIITTRIGITKGAETLWRFYIADSALVSRK